MQRMRINQIYSADFQAVLVHLFKGRLRFTAMVVLELLKYRVPAVIILLTLLIQWNQQIPHGIDLRLRLVIFLFSHVFPLHV
jgi:hypothetical protein